MKSQGGFTLVELMVCIAIIGILSAIAIPNFIRYRERGKVAKAQAELETLATIITMLALDSIVIRAVTLLRTLKMAGRNYI